MKNLETQTSQNKDDDGSGWLISYADLMTLIACFFILLIALAHFDPIGFNIKVTEISRHFRVDQYKSSEIPLRELKEEIVSHPEIETKSKVSLKDGELVLTFSASILFDEGNYELNPASFSTLDLLINTIRSKDHNYRILVEGHSSSTAELDGSRHSSNWAMSSARAASVVERFEFYGFDPEKLRPIGYADTKPLLPNYDIEGKPIKENQRMNRRVEIKVLEPIDERDKIKLGLGVYFKDATE